MFGTFDGIHEGHRNLFKQARALAFQPHLIVSIARDVNVERIKHHKPRKNEHARRLAVAADPLIDEAVLGSQENYIRHIVTLRPDIIALGYDQENEYTQQLEDKLKTAGCAAHVVRCNPFKPETYKNSIIHARETTKTH